MFTVDIKKLATYQLGMEKSIEKGIKRGIEKGIHLRNLQIAQKLLANGTDIAEITFITELPQAAIENLITPSHHPKTKTKPHEQPIPKPRPRRAAATGWTD